MEKKVLIYDTGTGGHRLPIQRVVTEHLKPDGYAFDMVVDESPENPLVSLGEIARRERFDHCHILTLHDCIETYRAGKEGIRLLEDLGVTLSGTYYHFTYLSPLLLMVRPPYIGKPRNLITHGLPIESEMAKHVKAAAAFMRSRSVKTVTIPDERISSWTRYPFGRKKLRLLPDPAIFANGPEDCLRAKKEMGWDDGLPVVLMFGGMKHWKGLDLLVEAVSTTNSNLFPNRFRLVLAGEQEEKRPEMTLAPSVELVEIDHYIEDDLAKKLLGAADCVVIPHKKYFEWSSGTFSLACASGKFLIVPDTGILGWRVRRLGNGLVYHADKAGSLAGSVAKFVEMYPALTYPVAGSVRYAATCTPERYVEALDQVIKAALTAGEQRPRKSYAPA